MKNCTTEEHKRKMLEMQIPNQKAWWILFSGRASYPVADLAALAWPLESRAGFTSGQLSTIVRKEYAKRKIAND